MKVQAAKRPLTDILEKMRDLSTKGIMQNFNFAGKVSFEATKSGLEIRSSNGYILASVQLNEGIDVIESGQVSVDAVRTSNLCSKLANSDECSTIELSVENGHFCIRNPHSSYKQEIRIPSETQDHDKLSSDKLEEKGFYFDTEQFIKTTSLLMPYQSPMNYRFRYQTILLHFLKNEVRLVCGDGSKFAVCRLPKDPKDETKKELQRLIQCAQIAVLNGLVSGSSQMKFTWQGRETLWIETDKQMRIRVQGLPEFDYVDYAENAYRFEEAVGVLDVKVDALKRAAEIIACLKDQERINQGFTHSFSFICNTESERLSFQITKQHGNFECEYEVPAKYYNLNDTPEFASNYAYDLFESLWKSSKHSYVRFYLLDPHAISIARDVELEESNSDELPKIKENEDNYQMSYFFAAMKSNDDESDED